MAKLDIVERLKNPEMCIDAIDDAILEIMEMREITVAFAKAVLAHDNKALAKAFERTIAYMKNADAQWER
mgnify:CR=1 FL=1